MIIVVYPKGVMARLEGCSSTHLAQRFITFLLEPIQHLDIDQFLDVFYPSEHVPCTLFV